MAFDNARPGDIRATLAISQEEARTGSSRMLNLPGGRAVTIRVPAGVQNGEEIRLRGQGEIGGPGGRVGDLILHISIITPNQRWIELAGPTEVSQQPFLSSATQNPTEFAVYPPYFSKSLPMQGIGGAYPPAPAAPQAYPPARAAYQSAPATPEPYSSYAPVEATSPPQPLRPNRRSGMMVFLVLLIVLVLFAGSASIYYLGYYQPNQQRVAGTQTAQAQATSAGQATAHTAASSTAQAQATAQAYQALYTQATGGTPALNDSMSSQSGSQWEELTSSVSGTCSFSGGSYHAVMPTTNYFQPCFATAQSFGNFAYQVNMSIVRGDEGGIIFRANEASSTFYLFRIDSTGTYDLYLYKNNQASQAQSLLSGQSSLILPGTRGNEITLIAQGSNLSLYINKQYLASVTDNTYNTGIIGVFGEDKTQTTDVAFSNIKVWILP